MGSKYQESPAKRGVFKGLKPGDVVTRRDGKIGRFDGYDPAWLKGAGLRGEGDMNPMPYTCTVAEYQLHYGEDGRAFKDAENTLDIVDSVPGSGPKPEPERPDLTDAHERGKATAGK
jgi:hypothetical protein